MGDGQIPYVVDHEVKAIHDTLINAGIEEKNVKFAFIVVNKRINTKFIQKVGGNHSNPPSGTIVDNVVTLPERYDSFLISQSVTQGTVNPTSYNVVKVSSSTSSFVLLYLLCPGYFWSVTRAPPEADLQTGPSLLQLARHRPCSCPLPIHPQGWSKSLLTFSPY